MRPAGKIGLRPIVRFIAPPSTALPFKSDSAVAATPMPLLAVPQRLTGPIEFILKLLEFWRLERGDAVGLLGFDQNDADHVAAVLDGRERFRGRDVKDRIRQLYSIRKTLWSLFRNLDDENDWLREAQPLLEGRTPLALISSSMEDLLLAKEYVDEVAGR